MSFSPPFSSANRPVTRVLAVGGSDSSGGAGVQADLKTVMALGGYAGTAITALTAQNTTGVGAVYPAPPGFVALQITMFLEDIGADAIKTGMLHSAEIIGEVADMLERYAAAVPLVVDPVLAAKGGARLLEASAERTMTTRLLPLAAVVTPNIPEAEQLTGIRIHDLGDMKQAASRLLEMGPRAVLLKGGHLPGDLVHDVLVSRDSLEVFTSPRIQTRHTHGTGCTLASAVATLLPRHERLRDAVEAARQYVFRAIKTAPGLGHGHGPLNHAALIDTALIGA